MSNKFIEKLDMNHQLDLMKLYLESVKDATEKLDESSFKNFKIKEEIKDTLDCCLEIVDIMKK